MDFHKKHYCFLDNARALRARARARARAARAGGFLFYLIRLEDPNLRNRSWILSVYWLIFFWIAFLEGRFQKIMIFKIHGLRYTTATTTPTPTHKHRTRLGANPRLEARRAARRATAHLPCAIEALRAI